MTRAYSKLLGAMMTVLVLACAASQVKADIILTDLNSTVRIDPTTQAGMYDWVVDGVDNMFQQWFWYRVGAVGPESAINTLTLTSTATTATHAEILFTDPGGAFDVLVKYDLTGGSPNSETSDVAETIRIRNLGGSSLDFHFFQYADFDLNGTPAGQSVNFVNSSMVRQSGAGAELTETVVTPPSTHHEADVFANTLGRLNDGVATTLNGVNSAFGDATWAFQWDPVILAGGSFLISKDKQLVPIPEPSSLVLLGLGSLGLGAWRRRRAV